MEDIKQLLEASQPSEEKPDKPGTILFHLSDFFATSGEQ